MHALLRFWHAIPFRPMTLLVIALLVIKEQFPFSHFPMYGNMTEEADVIFVTDQTDSPVAMSPLFGTGSAATKKRYKGELAAICNKAKRDTEQSTAEERQAAGKIELESLMKRLKREKLPPGVTELRLKIRTFAADARNGRIDVDRPAELLATETL
jgi:hypothetical protein